MNDEMRAKLEDIESMAIRHAIEEMDASDTRGLDSKEERGDRGFLTGMASKSLAVAVRVVGYILLKERGASFDPSSEEDQAQATDRMIRTARAELEAIRERSKMPAK